MLPAQRKFRMQLSPVVFLQGAANYTRLYFANGQQDLVAYPMKQLLLHRFPAFLRVHKSYAVNPAQIASLGRGAMQTAQVVLRIGSITYHLPVSRRQRKGVCYLAAQNEVSTLPSQPDAVAVPGDLI